MSTPKRSRASTSRRLSTALLSLLAAAGCLDATDPYLPRTAVQFVPDANYSAWWSMVERCAGRTGDFNAVRWYAVPSGTILHNDANAVAYWSSAGNHVVVEMDRETDAPTIRHEMLHALLRQPTHTREFFLDKCA